MTASRALGKLRGIPEDDLLLIDALHDKATIINRKGLSGALSEAQAREELTAIEFELQRLWRFPSDFDYHTYPNQFSFRKSWHGRKFQCISTGETVVIDASSLIECDLVKVGDGFVDVGRYGAYFRTSGCAEVTEWGR